MIYLIPTPIGNLEDITLRAIRLLKEVDLILAEDTRVSIKLLKHFEIGTPLQSFHMHNEHKKVETVVEQLKNGKTVALISDAGTPGISDPGFLLVREALKEGVEVQCLPGPTALIPALVQSGIPCDRFVFEGFLPPKKGRQTRLEQMSLETRTQVFYESPHKLLKTLEQLVTFFGANRSIAVVREISKLYESTFRGSAQEGLDFFEVHPPKGEFVIVIEGVKK
ncbi:16S rRNA (cytidine(1402)-2'-O)-methyltransferase [Flavobacteriaceae bacterium]|nr:16S rRNA (cytidine(1402)-2'-O)-methyltransferase [Flavobacteriaceae bacterium]MDB4063437.1 16S rRNA (cytidine(1402)-2'-O)-methyltransferase [Flavobacteriaceae bacterium]MDB4255832.1 16S rRNA (cytidine(1402)-2'-O)-methyltransferase [Flavobacteriaceae bacterium]MDC0000758.1 16S rRNA (cytidine(1402)-2'-O)-methyltransferase [Flavobacteriaceae bacterium]MDC1392777.1 16S rRNA (cytidine(1402)-2'-O)-methyltransferase [Flavobacteriaceae bacterium]